MAESLNNVHDTRKTKEEVIIQDLLSGPVVGQTFEEGIKLFVSWSDIFSFNITNVEGQKLYAPAYSIDPSTRSIHEGESIGHSRANFAPRRKYGTYASAAMVW